MKKKEKYLEDYNRLVDQAFGWLYNEENLPVANDTPASRTGAKYDPDGVSNLIPLKNKIKEAQAALEDALDDVNEGKGEDAKNALQAASAAIDQALGGVLSPTGMGGKG